MNALAAANKAAAASKPSLSELVANCQAKQVAVREAVQAAREAANLVATTQSWLHSLAPRAQLA